MWKDAHSDLVFHAKNNLTIVQEMGVAVSFQCLAVHAGQFGTS